LNPPECLLNSKACCSHERLSAPNSLIYGYLALICRSKRWILRTSVEDSTVGSLENSVAHTGAEVTSGAKMLITHLDIRVVSKLSKGGRMSSIVKHDYAFLGSSVSDSLAAGARSISAKPTGRIEQNRGYLRSDLGGGLLARLQWQFHAH
jgi:hypothetical protein